MPAFADEPVAAPDTTVIVTPTPAPSPTPQGWIVPTAEEVTVLTGTMGSPVLFFFTQYPFFRALDHNFKAWRALPTDKQDHFAVSEITAGIVSAFAFSFPPTRTDGTIVPAWKRLAVVGGAVFASGLLKEVADQGGYWAGQRDHGAEAGDLAADLAGCVVGVTVGALTGASSRVALGLVLGSDRGTLTASVRF